VSTHVGQALRLDRTAVWHHAPLLIAMNAALALALLPPVLLLLGGAVLAAPFAAAVTLGPTWAATVAVTDRMVVGAPVSAGVLVRMLREQWRPGLRIALVPAVVCASVASAADLAVGPSGGSLWIGSLAVALVAAVGVALALPFVFSLAATAELRGIRAWRTALLVAGFRPAQTLSVLALIALAGALAYLLGPGVVLVAPSLVALRCSAAIPFDIPVEDDDHR
jgi:hypothetical protein